MIQLPGLQFERGQTIEMPCDALRNFAEKEIAPRAASIDHENLFPHDLRKNLGDLGLHGLTID